MPATRGDPVSDDRIAPLTRYVDSERDSPLLASRTAQQMTIAASAPGWPTIVAAAIALVGSLVALVATGWVETLRLRSQHRSEERRKLRGLIGAYHGRLISAW